MASLTARCCCGALSIEVAGEPVLNAICHCGNCKRRTGSAFGWSVYFPDDRVLGSEGPAQIYRFESASGWQERHFCAACGATLWWRSAVFPGVTGIAGGCFAGGALGEPAASASDAGRCPWVALPEAWSRSP